MTDGDCTNRKFRTDVLTNKAYYADSGEIVSKVCWEILNAQEFELILSFMWFAGTPIFLLHRWWIQQSSIGCVLRKYDHMLDKTTCCTGRKDSWYPSKNCRKWFCHKRDEHIRAMPRTIRGILWSVQGCCCWLRGTLTFLN